MYSKEIKPNCADKIIAGKQINKQESAINLHKISLVPVAVYEPLQKVKNS